jgi:hypothetical protein
MAQRIAGQSGTAEHHGSAARGGRAAGLDRRRARYRRAGARRLVPAVDTAVSGSSSSASPTESPESAGPTLPECTELATTGCFCSLGALQPVPLRLLPEKDLLIQGFWPRLDESRGAPHRTQVS